MFPTRLRQYLLRSCIVAHTVPIVLHTRVRAHGIVLWMAEVEGEAKKKANILWLSKEERGNCCSNCELCNAVRSNWVGCEINNGDEVSQVAFQVSTRAKVSSMARLIDDDKARIRHSLCWWISFQTSAIYRLPFGPSNGWDVPVEHRIPILIQRSAHENSINTSLKIKSTWMPFFRSTPNPIENARLKHEWTSASTVHERGSAVSYFDFLRIFCLQCKRVIERDTHISFAFGKLNETTIFTRIPSVATFSLKNFVFRFALCISSINIFHLSRELFCILRTKMGEKTKKKQQQNNMKMEMKFQLIANALQMEWNTSFMWVRCNSVNVKSKTEHRKFNGRRPFPFSPAFYRLSPPKCVEFFFPPPDLCV